MTDAQRPQIGISYDPKPHAYDPVTRPEYFEGVLARRMMAFVLDAIIITVPILLSALFIFLFGIVTLGLGWMLFWLFSPATIIWILAYEGMTLGSPRSATIGMRVMDIQMRTWYGGPAYFLLGAVHAVLYWISVSVLTPLILLVGLINPRRRLLHDFVLGTVIVNSEARAASLRRSAAV
jgi:uncharacterized RDD family membrane protein YckC